jgi:uncharacterized cupredoxin-like copper-binding protein
VSWRRGALLALAGLVLVLASGCAEASGGGPREIEIRYSRFAPRTIIVPAGVPVTFLLRNRDPIEHEWIVGTEAVHERHRQGTEPYHAEVPTEVTVPALTARTTTVTFDKPGEYSFICHLPGHEAYGMRGTLRVVAQ